MKILLLLLAFVSFNAFALTIEGQVSVDGEDHKFSKTIELEKEYAFPMNTFLYKMTVTEAKNKKFKIRFNLMEGKKMITEGEKMISEKSEDFYMKGKPGQPNSIITLKISHK
jgi:ribosomal 50S subunit-recycling heat shock protein